MTFEAWVDGLNKTEVTSNYWKEKYEHYCTFSAANGPWASAHGGAPARKFREFLLGAARQPIQSSDGQRHQASIPFFWGIDSQWNEMGSKTSTDTHDDKYIIAQIYELGETFVVGEGGTQAKPEYVNGSPNEGAALHRKCNWLRASIRAKLDRCVAKEVRRNPEFFRFVGIDMSCCYEWRALNLGIFVKELEEIYQKLDDMAKPESLAVLSSLPGAEKFVLGPAGPPQEPPPNLKERVRKDFTHCSLTSLTDQVEKDKTRPCVLVLTATQDELFEALSVLGEEKMTFSHLQFSRVYRGGIGGFQILVTQCEPGSAGVGASQATVAEVLRRFPNVKCVVVLGICFGADPARQRLGDLVIADRIQPYENQRVSQDRPHEFRGYPIFSGRSLFSAFNDSISSFKFDQIQDEAEKEVQAHVGTVLSGEKLVDQEEFKLALLKQYSDAQGGEMEGVGVYCASYVKPGLEVVLAKAICDWGDGTKNKEWQPYCARLAAHFFKHVITTQGGRLTSDLQRP